MERTVDQLALQLQVAVKHSRGTRNEPGALEEQPLLRHLSSVWGFVFVFVCFVSFVATVFQGPMITYVMVWT